MHDACCGSDVFGTDICTCRPYLVYAIEQVYSSTSIDAYVEIRVVQAVECAQRGGVGLIIYFQKEGRSLGEGPLLYWAVLARSPPIWLW